MKRRAMNMFASTNEDLPLFSGACVDVAVAEFTPPVLVPECWITPEYSSDGMDGYYKGWMIAISYTTSDKWRVTIERGLYDVNRSYQPTLADAQAWAHTTIDNHKETAA